MFSKSLFLGLFLFLSFSMFGCTPATGPTKIDYYSPPGIYTGPIETVAILMQPKNNYSQEFHDVTYEYSVTSFFNHPYAKQRFDVIERQLIEQLLIEQDLIRGGYVDNSLGPRLGKLLGANYIPRMLVV